MHRISLILSTAALSLFNSGARAATNDIGSWATQPQIAPQPSMVAILALVGIGCLIMVAHAPIGATPSFRFKWPSLPGFLFSQRAAFALLAMIAISGSMGMA